MAEDSYSWIVWGVPLIVVASLLCCALLFYLLRRWIRGPMYKGQAENMNGKTILITGANTGIGKQTAYDLAKRGAKVILLCRNMDKGTAAAEDIRTRTSGTSVEVMKLDLSSFESIRECAALLKEQEPKIHVLINNAGIMMCPEMKTTDGLEMQIGTNHFGHFLLTLLLLDNIKAAAPSRIVTVSSLAHKMGSGKMNWKDINWTKNYSSTEAYTQSKLANVLFSSALARKLEGSGVTTYSLHPGVVKTELARHIGSVYGTVINFFNHILLNSVAKSAVLGAQTSIACAIDVKLGKDTGKYYNDCKEEKASKEGRSEENAEKLWQISLDTVDLKNFVV